MKNTTHALVLMLLTAALDAASAGCKSSAAAQTAKPAQPPVHVDKADVTDVNTPILLHLTGTLRGMREADLAANASGRVLKTFVERGDDVKAGQVVAQLDTSSAALMLKQASVDVDTSRTQDAINRSDCARFEQLHQKDAISPFEYDQAVAKCKTAPLAVLNAEARQSIAAKTIGDGTIRAPFAGIVSERYVEVGEYVQASSKVISISQSSDLRLAFNIPEANIAGITNGLDVSFQVAAYPDKYFHGTVRHIAGAVRETTRDLVAEAVVDNSDHLLRPGMFTDVSLTTGTHMLPSVPVAAVFERQDKKRVYVVKDGRLEERVLQDGPTIDGRLAIEGGVKTGEKVAVGDLTKLLNGQSVE